MSHDDRYYSVMVFQRYIRRRRISKKDKDPSGNEKYYKNIHGVLPAANLKERQIMTNSFSIFMRNNLVVDSKLFLQTTMAQKYRKKILSDTKNKKISLSDKKTNILVQSYIQSKEIKRCRNTNKNPLSIGGHIQIARSPLDNEEVIGPENVHIRFNSTNHIGPINIEDSESLKSDISDNYYQEFHFESGVGSEILEDIIDKNIGKYETESNNMKNLNKIEKGHFSQFFDEESSIIPSDEYSESGSPTKQDKIHHKVFNYLGKQKKESSESVSVTNFSHFFGNLHVLF